MDWGWCFDVKAQKPSLVRQGECIRNGHPKVHQRHDFCCMSTWLRFMIRWIEFVLHIWPLSQWIHQARFIQIANIVKLRIVAPSGVKWHGACFQNIIYISTTFVTLIFSFGRGFGSVLLGWLLLLIFLIV